MSSKRICVIGAGPSGMSVLFHFAKMDPIPDVVCYEKQSTWGGMWNLSWKTGVDEHGEPNHASMYKNLWTIGAKESYEYPDYTYEEHFGCVTPSYAPRAVIRNYLEGRWTRGASADLKRVINFNTVVRFVKYIDEKDEFVVTVNNLTTGKTREEIFSHVITATGIYSYPNLAEFPGMNDFQGRILHSHDFRDPREFSGQKVLIVGAGYSGEDISLQMIKFGAKRIVLSYKTRPKSETCILPEGLEERPVVDHFDKRTAYFKDGSSVEVDSVILTTGYRNYFPFLEDRFRVHEETHPYPEGLYNASLYYKEGNNKLFYVGVEEQFHTLTYIEVIAYWTCKYIMGYLPGEPNTSEEMKADSEVWVRKANACCSELDVVNFQAALIEHLANCADYPNKDIIKVKETLVEWIRVRQESLGLANFRDASYRSIYTGKLATKQTPFMQNYDDSMETYLKFK